MLHIIIEVLSIVLESEPAASTSTRKNTLSLLIIFSRSQSARVYNHFVFNQADKPMTARILAVLGHSEEQEGDKSIALTNFHIVAPHPSPLPDPKQPDHVNAQLAIGIPPGYKMAGRNPVSTPISLC